MTIAEIDAFVTAVIDAVHDPDADVGHLLAESTPGVDDAALVRLLEVTVALSHLSDSMCSLWAASADRAGLPARGRTSAIAMMKDLGVAPVVAARSVKVGAALHARAGRGEPRLERGQSVDLGGWQDSSGG